MKEFAGDFFSAFGAEVTEGRQALEVTLEGALAEHFGRERLDLVFDAGHLGTGRDLVTPGSRTFDLMVEYMSARGARTLQQLPVTYADSTADLPELRLHNCRIARRSRRKAQTVVGIFNFKITYTSDERVEELFAAAVDGEGRARSDVADRLADAQPVEGKPPITRPGLERLFGAAQEHAARHAEEQAAEREREILGRLHGEVSRLVAYYQQMIEELPFGPVEGADAQRHLRAELERKVSEEIEAHRLRVAISPVACCLIAVPEASYRVRLAGDDGEAALELRRDLHTGALQLPRCAGCEHETAEIGLCRGGHIACPGCLSRCAECGGEVCAGCGVEPCPVCGRAVCSQCAVRCPRCEGRACPEHATACPTCGERVCTQCQAECAGCHTLQCAEHLGACVGCEDLFCEACASRCAGCGGLACRDHARTCVACGRVFCAGCSTRCAVCGQGLCGDHATACRECGKAACPAHGGLCAECGQAVCAEHGRGCEECETTLCRECGVGCVVCGSVRCHEHRLVCAVCGRAACREHAQACAACGRPTCPEHAQQCAGCSARACDEHLEVCGICGQAYCPDCREQEEKCAFCAGLESAATVPDERVRAIAGLPRALRKYERWRMAENAACRIYLGEKGLGLAVVVTDREDRLLKAEELGWLSSLLGI